MHLFSFLLLFILLFCSKIVHENRTSLARVFLDDLSFILLSWWSYSFPICSFSVFFSGYHPCFPHWYGILRRLYFHLEGMLICLSRWSLPNLLYFCNTVVGFSLRLSLFVIEMLQMIYPFSCKNSQNVLLVQGV